MNTPEQEYEDRAMSYSVSDKDSDADGQRMTNLCRGGWCILCTSDDCYCHCHREKEIWP